MAIRDKTGELPSVTEGQRALDLFTDRKEAARRFANYLNDDPPQERILLFYGDGGNGKSLLLRFLRAHCCKRLGQDNWQYVKSLPDDQFLEHLQGAENADAVPIASLDFVQLDDRRAFDALLKLRRALTRHGLRFHIFDFACIWYLHKTNRLDKESLKTLFPTEEADVIFTIADVCSDSTWGTVAKGVVGLFHKHFATHMRESFTLWAHQRKLDEEQLQRIQRMDAEVELMASLPELFADDLNVAMSMQDAPKRIALFFDTHEAFWGQERDLANALTYERDEWLRRLLVTLEYSKGIVVVVAGREPPEWPNATKFKIPKDFLDLQLVWHFSEAHALEFLERAGVADAALRQSIVAYASVAKDQVHPYYLGLSADVVMSAAAQGKTLTPEEFVLTSASADKGRTLIDRLLRYVNQDAALAVRALSACRAFDRDIYFKLGTALKFTATEATFRVLTQFSFVRQLSPERGEGWFRIHDLLRRLFTERKDEITREADEVLEKHFREKGSANNPSARAEAIYHSYRLAADKGVLEWRTTFEAASGASQNSLCRALLHVLNDMSIQDGFSRGYVLVSKGQFLARLAFYDEAIQSYFNAVAVYDEALRRTPDNADMLNGKGAALGSIAKVQGELAQHDKAVVSLRQAIEVYDTILQHERNNMDALVGKAIALWGIAELQAGLVHDKIFVDHVSDRGAITQTELARYEQPLAGFQQAIAVYDEALRHAPNDIMALTGKGIVLEKVAEVQAQLKQHDKALASFQQAIDVYDTVLRHAPDNNIALGKKGEALEGIARMQGDLLQYDKALASFQRAIEVYNVLLRRTPDNVITLGNKAWTLHGIAMTRASSAQYDKALVSFEQAIAAHDQVLNRAPDHAVALKNKGKTLVMCGALQQQLSRRADALRCYEAALGALSRALELAPNNPIETMLKKEVERRIDELRST